MTSDTTRAPGRDTGRFDYLDGIRAVAIAAVVSLHWLSWYSPLFHGGSIGVDVFFVLSAFIITTILWRPGPGRLGPAWASFLRRRVKRLYPALLGLVVGCVVLYTLVPGRPLAPVEVAARGLRVLTQASAFWAAGQHGSMWLPGLQPFGQTWSLAIEWYFYALWPPVVLLARVRGVRPDRLAAALLAVAVLLYAGALALSPFWFYFGPPARFAELLAGAALALRLGVGERLRASARGRSSTPAAVLALVAVCGYALLGPGGHSWVYRGVGIPLAVVATAVLIATGYRHPRGVVRRLLSHRWPAAVGRVSYSLYLWHVVPLLLLEQEVAHVPRPVLGVAVLVATAALTWLSYRWLERPFLRSRRDLLGPARRREPVAAAPSA
ncbi:MAG: acyltransferase family protein [Nocardioidaceae bacterium]